MVESSLNIRICSLSVARGWTFIAKKKRFVLNLYFTSQDDIVHLVIISLSFGTVPRSFFVFYDIDSFEGFMSVIL